MKAKDHSTATVGGKQIHAYVMQPLLQLALPLSRFVYEKHGVTVYTKKNENSSIDWYVVLCTS